MQTAQDHVQIMLDEGVPLSYIESYIDRRRDLSESDRTYLKRAAAAAERHLARRRRANESGPRDETGAASGA